LDPYRSRWVPVVGCYEHCNESSGSIKGGEFSDWLSDYEVRFVAFPATEYDEVFSDCEPA